MTYFITYDIDDSLLVARSEHAAFSALSWLCDFHGISNDSLLEDWWNILHDFPADVIASFGDFSVESFSNCPSED